MNGRQLPANAAITPEHRWALTLRVGRWWRGFGTGLCFVVYACVGWLAGVTLLPLVSLCSGSGEQRQQRVRRLVSWSFRALLATIAGLRLGHVEVQGRQWLRQAEGKLLVANHPMYLDVVALVGLLPLADCVVKQAMWRNRLYRRFVKVLGYIGNADSVGLLHDCVDSLRSGRTLILFPEGTRSTPGEPLHFERGAAQVAVRSGCDILPVVIRCRPLVLGKHQAWHEVSDRPWVLELNICPPCSPAELGVTVDMPRAVAARRVNRALQALFVQQLGSGDAVPGCTGDGGVTGRAQEAT
ncbi:MAG: 1-acyl-sn-glycerol-3-phosphate acyltransferase [Nitrococcus sp.]|nr:1-acyl-sn-glycerol-3-phosphate acyltransferase [Nitrococcus sp.]